MLRAIGVYSVDGAKKLTITDFACAQPLTLFQANPLSTINLKQVSENMRGGYVVGQQDNQGYLYFKYFPELSLVFLLLAKKELFDDEPKYLLYNIKAVFMSKHVIELSLDDIIKNPLAYNGSASPLSKDVRIQKILGKLDELKKDLSQSVILLNERGESLSSLTQKTDDLVITTAEFKQRSKDLNRCCAGWW